MSHNKFQEDLRNLRKLTDGEAKHTVQEFWKNFNVTDAECDET
jgi:hypothetical protein